MARGKRIAVVEDWKALLTQDEGFRAALREYVQEVLEGEMDEALGASK
jgi:transposase-like protein